MFAKTVLGLRLFLLVADFYPTPPQSALPRFGPPRGAEGAPGLRPGSQEEEPPRDQGGVWDPEGGRSSPGAPQLQRSRWRLHAGFNDYPRILSAIDIHETAAINANAAHTTSTANTPNIKSIDITE